MVHRDGDEYLEYSQTMPWDNVHNDDGHKGRHTYDVPSDHNQNSDNQSMSCKDTENGPPSYDKKTTATETTELIVVQTTMYLTSKEFIIIHIFNRNNQNYE